MHAQFWKTSSVRRHFRRLDVSGKLKGHWIVYWSDKREGHLTTTWRILGSGPARVAGTNVGRPDFVRCCNSDTSKVDLKYLVRSEVRCWKRMEKISWTDRVRNWEVLYRVAEKRNILHTIKRRKANWSGRTFRRNCLLKRVITGKMEGGMEATGRRGIREKQLFDDLKREDAGIWKRKLWKRLWVRRKADYGLNEA
jgi:hypothetical protein